MARRPSYDSPLVVLSVVIAIVAGTAALWIGTWIRGAATVGAALVMGVAVCGMHYTGMAALRVHGGSMPSMAVRAVSGVSAVSGATAAAFLIPVLLVISLATFLLTLAISVSPSEDEVRADSELRRRTEYLERRQMQYSMRRSMRRRA